MADVNYSVVDFNDLSAVSDGKTLLYTDGQVCKSENNLSELIQSAVDKQVENKLDTTAFSTVSGNFLTAHQSLDGYATEQWVNEQGYLTEHQQIPESANWTETYETVTANSETWNNVSNIKSFTNIAGIGAETSADSLQITNGDNVSITTANKTITISAKDTTYSEDDFISASHLENIELASGYAKEWSDNSATIIANGNSGVSALNTITANSAAWSNGAFVTAALTTDENPVPDIPEPTNKVIYLTKEAGSTKTDPYTEWIYSDKWEIIGETTVPISDYYKKSETSGKDQLSTEFAKKLDSSDAATTYAPIDLTATVNTLTGSSATWNEVSAKFDTSAITSYYQKSETSAASEISAALDLKEDKVFVAEYNVTPYADIKAAYDAGKQIVCKYNPLPQFPDQTIFAYLTQYVPMGNAFCFAANHTANCFKMIECQLNGWNVREYEYIDLASISGEDNTITAINNSAIGGGSTGEYVPLSAEKCIIGKENVTGGDDTHYIFMQGYNNTACGDASLIQGKNNYAGDNSITVGNTNKANNGLACGEYTYGDDYSIAEGKYTSAISNSIAVGLTSRADTNSLAIGQNVSASTYSLSVGYNNSAMQDSIVVGRNNSAKYSSLVQGNGNSALGNYSVAVGERNYIYNDAKEAIAIGKDNSAYYDGAIALGTNGYALGTYTFVVGNGNSATNSQAIALGQNNSAHGEFAVTLSQSNTANGDNSFAVGYKNLADGNYSVVMGYQNTANKDYSIAMGNSNNATGTNSFAAGYSNNAGGAYAIALGYANTVTDGSNSFAIGQSNTVTGNYSFALGYYNQSQSAYSVTIGETNTAKGQNSVAIGRLNIASGTYAVAIGYNSVAGNNSDAIGYQVSSIGNISFAEGFQTIVPGDYAHGEGYTTTAAGNCSHTEGYCTKTTKDYAHAEGEESCANAYAAHTEGFATTANGDYSHTEGQETYAGSTANHAEGYQTKANASYTHAEGYKTMANGMYSHAEGYETMANGIYSHAEGCSANANGNASHAAGMGTISNYECETVVGSYNILAHDELPESGKPIFVVGNGSANNSRSDAFIVTKDGNTSANDFISNGVSLSGMIDLYNILTARPLTGTYTLKCVNGILSWVEDSNVPANAVGLNNEPVGVNGDYFTVGE